MDAFALTLAGMRRVGCFTIPGLVYA